MLKIPAGQQMYSNKWKGETTVMSYLDLTAQLSFALGQFSTTA